MDAHDFRTHIVIAVLVFLLSLPALWDATQGTYDNFGDFKILLFIGPAAMILLAILGRQLAASGPSPGGEDI